MADKYATRSWCAGLGGVSTPSNHTELVKATELTYLNCSLVTTPSMQYASNQYILQKDIKRREGTIVNSYVEYIGCTSESEIGIAVDQTATAYRDENGNLSENTYSGGIGITLPAGSMQTNIGYWMQGGSSAEEVNRVVTMHHLITIPSTIVIHTANYWSQDPSTLNIPQASCSVQITNTDNTVYQGTSRYFVSSCEKIGAAVDGKYKYRVEFTTTLPYVTTQNKSIKEILIMFSLYGDA